MACVRPEPVLLLAVSNIQMTGLYGNLLPGLLTGIQSYALQRDENYSEETAENLYCRHFRQRGLAESYKKH